MIIGLIFCLPLFQTRKRFRDCSLRVFALGMQASSIFLFAIRFFISSGGPVWSCISVFIVVLQANQLEEETRKLTKMLDRFRINATQVVIAVKIMILGVLSSCPPPLFHTKSCSCSKKGFKRDSDWHVGTKLSKKSPCTFNHYHHKIFVTISNPSQNLRSLWSQKLYWTGVPALICALSGLIWYFDNKTLSQEQAKLS